jgi:hypothetical protein
MFGGLVGFAILLFSIIWGVEWVAWFFQYGIPRPEWK